MFVEYDMATSEKFSGYFDFSDDEVDCLYKVYRRETRIPKFGREELRIWYDGYYTATGERLYNPCSVVLALNDNQLRNYWTSSGPYDEFFVIYSAMVVYGLLTYENGEVLIPNKELMDKFNELLLSKDSLGYVYDLARKSEQMLQATIAGDTKVMEEILQFAHNTESPILSYNNEVELAIIKELKNIIAELKYCNSLKERLF